MKRVSDVIVKPLITERSAALKEQGRFAFIVALQATKGEIKDAVKQLFPKSKVDVVKVNTTTLPGKRRRFGRTTAEPKRFKKAVVTLKPGQTLEFFEGA